MPTTQPKHFKFLNQNFKTSQKVITDNDKRMTKYSMGRYYHRTILHPHVLSPAPYEVTNRYTSNRT